MATHSSVLAWRIPGTGGAWWAAVYGVAQLDTTEATQQQQQQQLQIRITVSVNFDIADSMALIKFHGCVIISEAFQDLQYFYSKKIKNSDLLPKVLQATLRQ